MKTSEYFLKSLIYAAGVFVYIAVVAWFGFNNQNLFGSSPDFTAPLFFLLLFVVSASITGLLVLGKPIHLYLSGSKKEAFLLLFSIIAWLIVFLAFVVIVLSLK